MEPAEYDAIARLEERHWWYLGMRAIARDLVRRLPLPRRARLLDAGCGTGGGLRWLSEFGQPSGVDFHPLAVRQAARFTARVARASIMALPFPDGAFDCVTCFDVLYHAAVTDDRAALRELARVLAPAGWLVARVPAHNWLRGAHDRRVHTRHRYSAGELRAGLAQTGFHIRRLTPVGGLLLPFAILRRLAQPAGVVQSDVSLPPAFPNRLLTVLLSAERYWLRWADMPLGLSLLAVAQKS